MVAGNRFPENTYFPEMLISGKGKCIWVFGCLGNRFTENQFRCLIRPNILRKSFYGKLIPVLDSSKYFTKNTLRKILYGKSIPMFGSVKHFTKNEIRFLRKINSGVWFVNHFSENMKCVTNSSTCII